MKETITFRTEIEFQGSIQEFGKVVAVLKESPLLIRAEWPPEHTAGCWPTPLAEIVSGRVLDNAIEGMPRISADIIQGIRGGIREPHLHVGDEVVLLDRARFKEVVRQAATELAGGLAEKADYSEVVGAIRNLAPTAG
jgi:hypothetical protein